MRRFCWIVPLLAGILLIDGCAHPPSDHELVIGDALVVEQPTRLDPNAPPDSRYLLVVYFPRFTDIPVEAAFSVVNPQTGLTQDLFQVRTGFVPQIAWAN